MPKDRRKAIDCKLIEPSKTSPGYFKYRITIQELDGSINVVPAYGKDMQDAIERLIWNERYSAVSNKKATTPIIVFLLLSTIILSGILAYEHDNPLWILGAMLINLIFGLIAKFADNYLRK